MSGRLSCRRISKSDAVRTLARDRGISETAARRRFDKAVASYEDFIDLTESQRGFRYIDIKDPDEGFRVCSDTRSLKKIRKANEMSLSDVATSKPALTLFGSIAGYILGKVT